ncbi:hypothetical protein [Propionicimonas sp.]|uniref:hypothetical protein n=1 Tax=Propionicimonas sp. TaxID=1955623 RepID=UPI001838F06D|nr:hypothetical protein [Propionicimonas sp.]MBU3977342.1 hypothetical protein [Actinomycetota bacterium]MBA3021266.1 hypothetical protein [Propionicimonas sp.]MBU3985852.1 hypothetical protein [Actinomycetota bacterium]MBU4008637.1 hypothetical protein [Actinomycetota bacterium]MBU4066213.1 hypothetical protein [Actinomycetota bacterium]
MLLHGAIEFAQCQWDVGALHLSDFIPQIITAAATLIAAFGGVAIAQRHQRALADVERADRRRAELRTHVVEFIVSAREWSSQYEIVVFVLWKSSEDDFMALANSESFARIAVLRQNVTSELHHLIGLVGDERLQGAVYKVHDLWLDTPNSISGPVTDSSRKNDDDAPRQALRALREFEQAVTDLRNAAVLLLRVAIVEPKPTRWWQVGKRAVRWRARHSALARGSQPNAAE